MEIKDVDTRIRKSENALGVLYHEGQRDAIRTAVENAPEYTPGNPEIIMCQDFTDAVHKAAAAAETGDIVTMSPASAAFDQFKNFEYRGRYYKKLIKEL